MRLYPIVGEEGEGGGGWLPHTSRVIINTLSCDEWTVIQIAF